MSVQNFGVLARLEVAEKFVVGWWWGGGGWGGGGGVVVVQTSFRVQLSSS